MDEDNELSRAKWVLGSVLLFLASCWICSTELIYLLYGRETQATIKNVYEVTQTEYGVIPTGKHLSAEYTFTEPDGTARTASSNVGLTWPIPPDGKVRVTYTPGAEGRARLSGHVSWFGIGLFFGSLALLGFFGYRLWREASEEGKPRRGRA